MKDLFTDIFEYHHHFNQKVIELLVSNEDRITERSIPLMSHIVNAHQIWNSRILGLDSLGVHDIHTLKKCKSIDVDNFDKTFKILAEHDLSKQITYKTSKGVPFENTIRDILFHAANHTTHHRGQIISDLRQHDIEPIITDYIFYKR